MKNNLFAVASLLALVLALGVALRISTEHGGFQSVVNKSLATTEGYDQKFIDMVDHLEEVLTTRASFSYPGGKDPMTGKRREVAQTPLAAAPVKRRSPAQTQKGQSPPKNAPAPAQPADTAYSDAVKITAIIADDYGQHTAIVMNGERSLSVDVGDMVGDRKVVKITGKEVVMESDSAVLTYGINGSKTRHRK